MKLIPKKLGKFKYLKGVLEKKKPKPVEEKKEVKKSKIATMPCLSSNKKDREKKSQPPPLKDSTSKKPSMFKSIEKQNDKLVTTLLKRGGLQREVGTQIIYKSDG